jgi:hypothetical protein
VSERNTRKSQAAGGKADYFYLKDIDRTVRE